MKKCKDCSKEIWRNSIRCKSCSNKFYGFFKEWNKTHKGYNSGSKNGMWKGDQVGYIALHEYIRHRKPKPALCVKCNIRPAFDLANISGNYTRDIDDYDWLCRRCHMEGDGRLAIMLRGLPHPVRRFVNSVS